MKRRLSQIGTVCALLYLLSLNYRIWAGVPLNVYGRIAVSVCAFMVGLRLIREDFFTEDAQSATGGPQ